MSRTRRERWIFLFAAIALGLVAAAGYCRWTGQVPALLLEILVRRIQLPPGFKIELYATGVPNARSLTLSPGGIVFVGSKRAGKVYALVGDGRKRQGSRSDYDCARSGRAEWRGFSRWVAVRGGSEPRAALRRHRSAAEKSSRAGGAEQRPAAHRTPRMEIHRIRTGRVAVRGSGRAVQCMRIGGQARGKHFADARGRIRHGSVCAGRAQFGGFDWRPKSQEMWFTDNGRDGMGDDIPPDELNYAPRAGMNFGFPYCHGKDIADPQFGRGHSCAEFVPPAWSLPAHVAAVGMRFYAGGHVSGGIQATEYLSRSMVRGIAACRLVIG